MALVKCGECGHDVSTEAAACPNCGARPKAAAAPTAPYKPSIILKVAVIVLVGFFAIIFLLMFAITPSQPQPSDTGTQAKPQSAAAPTQAAAQKPAEEPPLGKAEAAKALSAYVLEVQARIFAHSALQQILLSKLQQDAQWNNLDKFREDAENLKTETMDFQNKVTAISYPDNLKEDDGAKFDDVIQAVAMFAGAEVEVAADIAVYAHTGMDFSGELAKDTATSKKAKKAVNAAVLAAYKQFGVPASKINKENLTLIAQ